MPYTILRVAKLSTLGNIGASAQHTFREQDKAPNADPTRTHLNEHQGAASSREVVDGVKARLDTLDRKVHKKAVLTIEYFIGTSPEWPIGKSDAEIAEYFRRAREFLVEKHGAENVVYFGTQRDERTPHAVAYVVPVNDRGRLSCSTFLNGREKLRELQTAWASKVADLGLERGVQGSVAQHEDVQRFWGAVQTAEKAPAPDLAAVAAAKIVLEQKNRSLDLERRRYAGQELRVDRKVEAIVTDRERAAKESYRESVRPAYQKRIAERDEARAQLAEVSADRDTERELRVEREVACVERDIQHAATKNVKVLYLPVDAERWIEKWATATLHRVVITAKRLGVHLTCKTSKKSDDRLNDAWAHVVDPAANDRGADLTR